MGYDWAGYPDWAIPGDSEGKLLVQSRAQAVVEFMQSQGNDDRSGGEPDAYKGGAVPVNARQPSARDYFKNPNAESGCC